MSTQNITNNLIEQLSDSNTALLCNALDYLNIPVPYMDSTILCMTPDLLPLVGEAITIKIDSSTPGGKSDEDEYWKLLEEIEKSSLKKVVVAQAVGSDIKKECVLGDGMAKTLISVGAVGFITNGGIRDLKDVLNEGFKLFASGRVVSHRKIRYRKFNEPITVGGIEIKSGDLIHGDSDGCIVVPKESYGKITKTCRLVLNFEKKAHVVLRQTGISLKKKKLQLEEFLKELEEDISKIRKFDI